MREDQEEETKLSVCVWLCVSLLGLRKREHRIASTGRGP